MRIFRTKAKLAVPLFALASCAPLPDLSGYTAATTSVRQSAVTVGQAVEREISSATSAASSDQARESLKQSQAAFSAAWQHNVGAMDAMIRYAQSIEAIASAGNDGAKSAGRVADAVRDLAGSLGLPIGPVVGLVSETGVKLYQQVALIRAARSLKASLVAADPAIQQLAMIAAANVDSADIAFNQSVSAQADALRAPGVGGFGEYLALDALLDQRERDAAQQLAARTAGNGDGAAIAAVRAKMLSFADARAAIAGPLDQYRQRRDALEARRRAGLDLITATHSALAAWADAHTALTASVLNHRAVTTASLEAAVADLRDLISKWRAL